MKIQFTFLKKVIFLTGFLLTISNIIYADYLIVQRESYIRNSASGTADIIEKVNKGDTLVLLDNGVKVNGYYQVVGPNTHKEGFIYQNRVRRRTGDFQYLVDSTQFVWNSTIPEGYYTNTENLEGESLKTALYHIIKNHQEFPYTSSSTDVWDALKETDKDLADPTKVRLLYTNRSRDAEKEYDSGNGWTREHVWAKSHGDFGTKNGAGTDLHHLRPVDASVNSARNNKDFDNGGEEYIDGDYPSGNLSDSDSWEPNDNVKGDVARMIFYMAVRYEGENGEPDLELSDEVNTAPAPLHGKLTILLEWHESDPVDAWERRRNDIIFEQFQGNRNPFIDHPEFASKIW
ncbi:MAG: endonuclease [Cyclobacteriaceae bacterium]|nr:endonuclease [Cyclobacteriaceae bacterium]